MVLRIPRITAGEIRRHAEGDYPNECCGALLGRQDAGGKTVQWLEPMRNRSDATSARRRFFITADDYREIETLARERSLEILGFYHSHPDHPAAPSDYDREHALPWYSYLIVSVQDGRSTDMASWVLVNDRSRFEREEIE
jgi:proteasome lid subunit RPN8/RPN11